MESVQLAEVLPPECAAQSRLSGFGNEFLSVVFWEKTIHSIPKSFFFSPKKKDLPTMSYYILRLSSVKYSNPEYGAISMTLSKLQHAGSEYIYFPENIHFK